jgi:hypothetical protein
VPAAYKLPQNVTEIQSFIIQEEHFFYAIHGPFLKYRLKYPVIRVILFCATSWKREEGVDFPLPSKLGLLNFMSQYCPQYL